MCNLGDSVKDLWKRDEKMAYQDIGYLYAMKKKSESVQSRMCNFGKIC